jgi:hypothetical protein
MAAVRVIRFLRRLLDVDDSAIAVGKTVQVRAGVGAEPPFVHEYVVPAGGGGIPGGVDGDIQYNNANVFGGISQSLFDVDPATGAVTISPSDATTALSIFSIADPGNGTALEVNTAGGLALGIGDFDASTSYLVIGNVFDHIGFFSTTPAVQPAAPTTMNEVVSAQQTL